MDCGNDDGNGPVEQECHLLSPHRHHSASSSISRGTLLEGQTGSLATTSRKGAIMAEEFSMDAAKTIIEDGIAQAQELMNNPDKIDALLADIDQKIMGLPDAVKTGLTNVPTMASMIKSYVTKEYPEVSPKVVASMVAAFLYLVKGKDLLPDGIPVLGYADDLAVIALAVKLNEPELEAFKAWKAVQPTTDPVAEA
ncbi:MAG: DUF1232 domain-containing protein [Olsenella sp.]|nr:DUF1232 domain-containing protein [Olsenella sp.]